MKIKALINFSGRSINMHKGQIKEVSNETLLADLLDAGYVEIVEKQEEAVSVQHETKKKPAKAVKTDESKRNKSK